jgi:hypothetical protein
MGRVIVKKGNIDRSDIFRALITDTAPLDVPIVMSNDGFHSNLVRKPTSPQLKAIVSSLITQNSQPYTVPYRYRIRLSPTTSRQISLSHPSAQAKACELYGSFGHLIPYFCRHDFISRRRPAKIGSAVSRSTIASGRKQYKGSPIDTLLEDQIVRNPGSFFAYSGYNRFHEFFSADEFVDLERRFNLMRRTDVSKCFASIYSHTLAWAVKDVQHGKESTSAHSFANAFDDLMQFANYNETNGIPVGWEVSRIFAEVILQAVDLALVRRAKAEGLVHGRDFEVRRYIDDYAIFANTAEAADAVQRGLSEALGVYNLHLNEQKTATTIRPLQTPKAGVITSVRRSLASLEVILTMRANNQRDLLPTAIRNGSAVVRLFTQEIRLACAESNATYADVVPYLISSLTNLSSRLVNSHASSKKEAAKLRHNYLSVFEVLVRLSYFFFGLHPTVKASYQVAQTTILALKLFKRHFADMLPALEDTIRTQIQGIVDDPQHINPKMSGWVPVESWNIVLAGAALSEPFAINVDRLARRALKVGSIDYFSLVCLSFYYGGKDAGFTDRLERRIVDSLLPTAMPTKNAHDAHAMLDFVACPHIHQNLRVKLLEALQSALQLPAGTPAEQSACIQEIEANPWFVNWAEIDLLSHLRKKELSAIY